MKRVIVRMFRNGKGWHTRCQRCWDRASLSDFPTAVDYATRHANEHRSHP